MRTDALRRWYAAHGRHTLPWRSTHDPWAVLVSEVMLQQTQVARVVPKWEAFMARWPSPEACAGAELTEVLRLWQGLGYPRRALALHRCAQIVSAQGWPKSQAGLRALPGVGAYTARALLALAFRRPGRPPLDVNIRRVGARAGLAAEPHQVTDAAVEEALMTARPARMSRRDYTLALFDAGALHCRAVPRCDGCPLAGGCAWRRRPPAAAAGERRRQPRYEGSFRQLRGALLDAWLRTRSGDEAELAAAAAAGLQSAADAERVARALHSLVADGLIPAERAPSQAG
ncbi:MAG: A/G-specific adenine glycosylase [Candidatus Dormibacteraeota bacterium]|nr:A/G-specific adenine glycosylase [Candidatus Dormibacteraeota bacterium]MBV9524386.1 A/G-specific adenine glycosylase [Candidatus Dormibacteraeota bacterium]